MVVQMVQLNLKKFDPSKIASDKVCIFVGKRGTGKSTLVTDIMYHKRDIPVGVVMSATEDGNHYYKQFIPDTFIHGDYNKAVIERVIDRQKKCVSAGRMSPSFILLDDCMYDRTFLKDTCIRQCFMNGRHWKIFFLLTMQYCMDLSPDLRANVDYVFVLREPVIQNREKLWKSFFGIIPNFHMFNDIMDACTENYECLVLDNTSKSNKIEDCIFYYKAKIRPPFKIGGPSMWKYHASNYKKSSGDHCPPVPRNKSGVLVKKA